METTQLDKALAETIKNISDVTPETIEKITTAYTSAIVADATVSIWVLSIMGAFLLISALVTFVKEIEFFPYLVFILSLLCFLGVGNSISHLHAPEAYAVKHLTDKVLK